MSKRVVLPNAVLVVLCRNPVDLDDTNWRITPVDTTAKDSLNLEALQVMSLGLLRLRRGNRDALGKSRCLSSDDS